MAVFQDKEPYPSREDPHARAQRVAAVVRQKTESGKRRFIDPTTCEIDYAADEVEFMMAMQRYKETRQRPFPTMKETLEVLKALGYKKEKDHGLTAGSAAPLKAHHG